MIADLAKNKLSNKALKLFLGNSSKKHGLENATIAGFFETGLINVTQNSFVGHSLMECNDYRIFI